MKRILICILLLLPWFFGNGQTAFQRVEPLWWWTGMKHPELQLMIEASNIGEATVNLNYPGVKLVRATPGENKNFLFLDLLVTPEAKPGKMNLEFTSTSKKKLVYPYELKARDGAVKAQGVGQTDIIYLITPDRFANGNPVNDDMTGMKEKKNREFHGGRHGGDLDGILSKITYMRELGVTTVWSSPVLENNMPNYSYHGYAITDFYHVDPRFGTNEQYKKLGEELHKNNMKLVMDMVFNHCGVEHWWMKDMPFADWIHDYPNFVETNHAKSAVSDTHGTEGDRRRMERGWFVPTMPDMNQDNPFMAAYLIQNSVWWIEYAGLDGIRMDTYPYNNKQFMADWATRVLDEYPNFYMVGESWVNSIPQEAYWSGKSKGEKGFNSFIPMTDFPLCFAVHNAFRKDGDVSRLYDVICEDYLYSKPEANKVFGDNHDMDRLFYILDQNTDKFKMALTFILTTRGIPQIYYGTELGLKGNDQHGVIRGDFPGGWPSDNHNAFTKEGRTAQENEIYDHLQKLLHWRHSSDAIANGTLKHFVPIGNVYVYNQKSDKESVVVIINNGDKAQKINTQRYDEFFSGYDGASDLLTGKKFDNLHEIDVDANTGLVLTLTPAAKAQR